ACVDEKSLESAQLIVLSGGFSYGDYVMAGRLAQLELERRVGDALMRFRDGGGYLLGICNGFQILPKLGLLPEGSLINNTSGRFICRWVKLKRRVDDNPFLRGLPENFELPIAHAEGRFVAPEGAAEKYMDEGLAALVYEEDVNGSTSRIAGLTDSSGRVLGLMPHPERFLWDSHHYDQDWSGDDGRGSGYQMFKSIYNTIAGEIAHEPG
ncbi:MAG: phosphoribosylformylglycinamidine synthase, partial [Akkermansiaceae bacterium]|nr:phosphoribosylformylglycinamidine synthase [Akkermansiaceae bacterium]